MKEVFYISESNKFVEMIHSIGTYPELEFFCGQFEPCFAKLMKRYNRYFTWILQIVELFYQKLTNFSDI